MVELSGYLDGKKLYGDDFTAEQIQQWYEEEKEAYFDLIANKENSYKYCYSALNYEHGFRFLPDKRFSQVLSIGGAYGEELLPIINKTDQITILESSDKFIKHNCEKNQNLRYVQARPDGQIPYEENYFDLITCFGTLHHIPNISKVLSELYQVL